MCFSRQTITTSSLLGADNNMMMMIDYATVQMSHQPNKVPVDIIGDPFCCDT